MPQPSKFILKMLPDLQEKEPINSIIAICVYLWLCFGGSKGNRSLPKAQNYLYILNVTASNRVGTLIPQCFLFCLLTSFLYRTANRKLHDSNDGLRSALENTYSKLNRSLVCDIISQDIEFFLLISGLWKKTMWYFRITACWSYSETPLT